MCGRYVIMDDGDIEEIYKILQNISMRYSETGASAKTGEIFPTDNAPVLSVNEGKPSLSLMKWGFPKWNSKGVIINAKAETVAGKKVFAKAITQRRCVIPSTGFYEWGGVGDDGKSKVKYQFNTPDSPMLYMAGVYTDERFVILTRSANESIRTIHDRMPVILYKHELVSWLTDYQFADFAMKRDSTKLVRTTAQEK